MAAESSWRYPFELKSCVVRGGEVRGEHESLWAGMSRVAELLGIGMAEMACRWCRQAQIDAGGQPG